MRALCLKEDTQDRDCGVSRLGKLKRVTLTSISQIPPVHVRDAKSGDLPSYPFYVKKKKISDQARSHEVYPAYTGAPVMAALSGNVRPHVGQVQRFLCFCVLPHFVASNPCSFLVLHFISASAECINKAVLLAGWHGEWEPDAQSSATRTVHPWDSPFVQPLLFRGVVLYF